MGFFLGIKVDFQHLSGALPISSEHKEVGLYPLLCLTDLDLSFHYGDFEAGLG